MVSTEAPAPPLFQVTDQSVKRRRGLELFCLSFLALFLELMVIRWAPAVVRLIAYYANLILISSFLGLGVGAILGKKVKSLFAWLPALLLINVVWLLVAHFVTLPTTASESRFYTPTPQLVRYVSLVGIFLSNAIVFMPLGQRIGSLFETLPPLLAYPGTWVAASRERCVLVFSPSGTFRQRLEWDSWLSQSFCFFPAGSGCDRSLS